MTRRLRSLFPAWLATLLLVATGASVLVAVAEAMGLYYEYAAGRGRGIGFTWMFHILAERFGLNSSYYLPAPAVRYYELRSAPQLVHFLWVATVANTMFSWLLAAAAAPIYRLAAGRRASLPALWLLFLSPVVIHIIFEASIPTLLYSYRVRVPVALMLLLVLWTLLSWKVPAGAVVRLVRKTCVAGVALGGLIAVGAGLVAMPRAVRSHNAPPPGRTRISCSFRLIRSARIISSRTAIGGKPARRSMP